MILKRFKSFINENDNLVKSVSKMNKFGMNTDFGNYIVFNFRNPNNVEINTFTSKEESRKFINNYIDDIEKYECSEKHCKISDSLYIWDSIIFKIFKINDCNNIKIYDGEWNKTLDIRNVNFYTAEGIKMDISKNVYYYKNDNYYNGSQFVFKPTIEDLKLTYHYKDCFEIKKLEFNF